MPDWKRAAAVDDCPPGETLETVLAGRVVALCRVDDDFFALDGVCPHQGGPLGKGTLEGCTLTCPWHGWQFDVRTGASRVSASIVQPSLPVRVQDGAVYVDVCAAVEP